jgi:hypothetical protein
VRSAGICSGRRKAGLTEKVEAGERLTGQDVEDLF